MRGDLEFGTLPRLLAIAADRHSDRIALEDGEVRLTFPELRDMALSVAAGLRELGVERGDRVAIWAPNSWEWAVVAMAIPCAGGALVPINTRYKPAEARYVLDRSAARALFVADGFKGIDVSALQLDLPVITDLGPWLGNEPEAPVDVGPDDVADVLFTSGTTGRPKGAMATHVQTLRAYRDWADVVGLRAGDRYLVVAPFFHCFGYKAGLLASLMTGATVLPHAVFDVDAVLARIGRDRVSVLPGPPALYQSLLQRDLSGVDLSTLRLAVTGAASIPVSLVREMRDELGFDTVITGYGLTEACGIATMCRFDDDPHTTATTSGRAIPGVEVKVVDAAGDALPAGEPGHVLVRGYNVMSGYLGDPEATAEAVVDGWLHTGDVGVLDERGYLRITDRIKDMFIVGGFNAYPAEIENALLEHPAVAEVAVVGMPDERLGEVGAAFVVPRGELEPGELIAWARDRIANFKVPRRVELVAALPRNASGKVLKTELRRAL